MTTPHKPKPKNSTIKYLLTNHPIPTIVALVTSIITIVNGILQAIHIMIRW